MPPQVYYVVAGIDKSIGGIMCGKLHGAKTESIKCAQQVYIAIKVITAFQIQERRDLAFLIDASMSEAFSANSIR